MLIHQLAVYRYIYQKRLIPIELSFSKNYKQMVSRLTWQDPWRILPYHEMSSNIEDLPESL